MALKKTVISFFFILVALTLTALLVGHTFTVNYFLVSNDLSDIKHHSKNYPITTCEPLVMIHHTQSSKEQGLQAALNKLFQDTHRHRNGKFNPLRHSKLRAFVYPGKVTDVKITGQFLPESECHLELFKQQIESTISLYTENKPYLIYFNGQVENFINLFPQN